MDELARHIRVLTAGVGRELRQAALVFVLSMGGRLVIAAEPRVVIITGGGGTDYREMAGIAILEETCAAGHAASCFELARRYSTGDGVKKNGERAAAILLAQCNAGRREACLEAARHYDAIRTHDPREWEPALRVACDDGHLAACTKLGEILSRIDRRGRLHQRALVVLQRACSGGAADGCLALGDALATSTTTAFGNESAAAAYERGCRGGQGRACERLGMLWVRGCGVPRDRGAGAECLQESCDLGVATACGRLAELLLEDQGQSDHARIISLLERAIAGEDAQAMRRLATAHLHGELGFVRDVGRGRALLIRACRLGDKPACRQLESAGDSGWSERR